MSEGEINAWIFLVWFVVAVAVFLAFCIANRRAKPSDKDTPAEVIIVSMFWPLMAAVILALAPFMGLAWVYKKLAGVL